MAFMAATESSFNGYTADDETVNQLADASWQALLGAAAANQVDPGPYSYVYVSETLPETLSLWENGTTVLTSPTNTGIPGEPTALGTYPIYVRYTFNYMSGFNPDGSHYDDPVYWINYFNGGDAVHGFVRASYGSPQSLGCVELAHPDRPGRLQPPTYYKNADEFTELGNASGLTPFGGDPNFEGSHEGGENLKDIHDGDWAACPHVLFTGATEFHARAASDPVGGTIEVHLDSLDGPLVAQLQVPLTGGGQTWVNISAPLTPVSGEHTVFLRFHGAKTGSLFKITSFNLTPAPPAGGGSSAEAKVVYALGCGVVEDQDPALFSRAVAAARQSDVALVFVGVNEQVDKESHDRSYIHLSGAQHELVQAVYAANPRTILVVSSNAPVAINWEQDNLPAIVGGLFLGEQQGNALVDVLFGNYNPGGKISTTWYRSVEDLPDFHDYNIRLGRTYMYFRGKPLYPFGYGLSYTEFQYKNLRLSGKNLAPGGKVTLSFELTNSGRVDGDEIAQLYIHCAGGPVERPLMQLADFERIHVKAGETRTVSLALPHSHFALRCWDESKNEFVITPGAVDVMVGASSADIRLKDTLQLTA